MSEDTITTEDVPTDATAATKPRIWHSGTGYMCEDPNTGKLIQSPSRVELERRLGLIESAQEQAASAAAAHQADVDQRKAEAAAELPDLKARHAQAEQDVAAAWDTFARTAVDGGPWLDAFARYRIARRHERSARFHVSDATHRANHGYESRINFNYEAPKLADTLDRVLTDHEQQLRQAGEA